MGHASLFIQTDASFTDEFDLFWLGTDGSAPIYATLVEYYG